MRRFTLNIAAAMLLAACGGGSDEAASNDAATPTRGTVDGRRPRTEPAATEPPPSTEPPVTEAPTTTAAATTTTLAPAPLATVAALIASDTPVNLSHAGGDQAAPHSTMFAFREGLAAGADALEMDVQLTGDGVLIVQHDDTVDKTTNTTGPVADLTLDEIQALDNAYWFSPQCWPCQDRPVEEYVYRGMRTGDVTPPVGYTADDFRVETFRAVAEAFPDVVLDVEIKGSFPDAIPVVERLAAEIDELGLTERIVVVSFDDQLLDAFHELAPDVVLSPGLARLTDWFLNGAEIEPHFSIFQVPPFQGDIEVVNAETVQRVHDEGRVVWVWPDDASTQENAEFYAKLIADGVDGIITGRPAAMVDALRQLTRPTRAAARTVLRPSCLATYIASSARRTQLVTVSSGSISATPKEAVTPTSISRRRSSSRCLDRQRLSRIGHHEEELFAAPSAHMIARADEGCEDLGHVAERVIAGFVAERVVELLEVIQVEEHQRCGLTGFVCVDARSC